MKPIIEYKEYGIVSLNLKSIMDKKKITVSKMVKISGLHHNVIQRYYDNEATRYDAVILAKLCYILECDIPNLIIYESPDSP